MSQTPSMILLLLRLYQHSHSSSSTASHLQLQIHFITRKKKRYTSERPLTFYDGFGNDIWIHSPMPPPRISCTVLSLLNSFSKEEPIPIWEDKSATGLQLGFRFSQIPEVSKILCQKQIIKCRWITKSQSERTAWIRRRE